MTAGLAGVEPEHVDPESVVVVAQLLPQVGARVGVRGVIERNRRRDRGATVGELRVEWRSALRRDEQPVAQHLCVVLRQGAHRRPDRDHQLDAHVVELADHAARIGPFARLEAPVAVMWPVEEVADDHRERQPAPLVLAGDGEQLVLRPIAELRLPEAGRPGRERRRIAGRLGVLRGDIGRRADRQPVVDLPCAVGHPARPGPAELDAADSGVVPEKAVAATRDEKGNRDLGVALFEVDNDALLVETPVLVLAEAEEPLARVRAELLLDPVVAVSIRAKAPCAGPQVADGLLGEQLFAVGHPREAQATVLVEVDGDVVDLEPRTLAFEGRRTCRRGRCEERAEPVVVVRAERDAHADARSSPRLDADRLASVLSNDRGCGRRLDALAVGRGLQHARLLRFVWTVRIDAHRRCASTRAEATPSVRQTQPLTSISVSFSIAG